MYAAVSTNVERVMGRAILDQAFRHQLFADPEAATCQAGLNLSATEMTHLKTSLSQINTTSDRLDPQFQGPLGYW